MPGREARNNITKALNQIHSTHLNKIEGLLISTDAEKAFDQVKWDYMSAICKHIGLQNKMRPWIATLYTSPTAKILISGTFFDNIKIKNGTTQDCPLSPLLLTISLEPFIHLINQNASIHCFKTAKREFKLAAYADDLLFFF